MANPERGEVDLAVNGDVYVLRSTTNAIRSLERRVGKPYGQILRGLDEMGHEDLTQFLFTLLQPYHSKKFKSVDDVGNLIDEAGGFTEVYGPIIELLILNKPKPKAEKEGSANPPAAQAGTGDNSGSTPDASA